MSHATNSGKTSQSRGRPSSPAMRSATSSSKRRPRASPPTSATTRTCGRRSCSRAARGRQWPTTPTCGSTCGRC